ncbi:hypothetical protein EUTSA_v10001845mg, partial [Eutrema salsugineum]
MSLTHRVVRHNKRLRESRYSPYVKGTAFTKMEEKQKEEAVQLGVELSLFVAEAMFLLSDDIRSVSLFCFWILRRAGNGDYRGPAVGRVSRVIQYVFATYIKPKKRVYHDGGKSIQCQLIGTFQKNFIFGMRGLAHIVSILKIGGLVKPSVLEHYNQELKKLEENLRSVRDVSEANGFSRELIEFNILHLWKSLFETTPLKMSPDKTIMIELFG